MPSTTNITQGVKAIKVSRFDTQGNDNSISLQELKVLRVNLGGSTVTQFNVLSIAEYPTYYLFYVEPLDFDPINIGYFTGATAVDAGMLTGGTYTLTPGSNTGRVSNYSVPSPTSGSYVATTGQFTPYIPTTVTVVVQYQVSQPVLDTNDLFRVELTGSQGVQTGSNSWISTGTFENAPGSWNPVTQSIQWTPSNPSSSVGIRFNAGGLNNQALTFGIGSVKVYYNQPDLYQDNLNIPDLDFTAVAPSTALSLSSGLSNQITNLVEQTSSPYWDPFTSEFNTPLNNFYRIDYTSSIQVRYTSSSPGTGNATARLSLDGNNGTIGSTSYVLASGTSWTTINLSGSFTPDATDALSLSIAEIGLTRDMQYRSASLEFNNIFAAHVEGNLVVLEPYSSENFNNSDYNALLNNSEEDRINDFFMDVDYSTDARVPVNYQAIISGSAERARVQYSNYTVAGWTNARYNGCENTSPDFNISGSSTYSPSVSSMGTYFAYFDQVGGSNYELFNKANFRIKYLIDQSGSIFASDISSSYYPNLLDTFNQNGNKANIVFRTTDGNVDNISGLKPVIKSGVLARAVIFSQTGSNPGASLASMSFNGGFNNTVPNYSANTSLGTSPGLDPNTFYLLDIASINGNTGSDAQVNLTNDYLAITASTAETKISPRANVKFLYYDEIRERSGIATLQIEKSTNGTTWNTYQTEQISIPSSTQTQQFSILGTPDIATSGSQYRFKFSISSSYGTEINLVNGGTAYFFQNVSPISTASLASNYWVTGSTDKTWITGSQFNSNIYGLIQDTVSGSGYDDPYLPFIVQKGDEFRFQANENNVYQVIDVIEPGNNSSDTLYVLLDKPIASGTNVNNFFLRRYNPNANYVIVDALKDGNTGGGTGFLIPEYPQSEIKTNFDAIVKILTEKGII